MAEEKDCKCCHCGKEAVAFWPNVDPDIQSYPYCRECLDEAEHRVMQELMKVKYNGRRK